MAEKSELTHSAVQVQTAATGQDSKPLDSERLCEQSGYILDETLFRSTHGFGPDVPIKTLNGLVLIPQPSDDPEDPLNWPRWKKLTILFMLAVCAFSADYSAATGASALIPQAMEWHQTPDTINHAIAGNTFMLGVGGLFTVWLSYIMGRLPVLFYFALLSAATAAWSAAALSFESYMASRILNGFFSISAAGAGLMVINDMFFFHERPATVNAWAATLISSPFLGPCFMAGIVAEHSWRDGMWLNFAIIAAGLVLIIFIGEETIYPRYRQPVHTVSIYGQPSIMRLLGVSQLRTRWTGISVLDATLRPLRTICKFPILVICLFYFFDFGWSVANNTTISVLTHFPPSKLAALYVAPILGALLGLVVGHWVFDICGKWYAKKHGGRIEPEARLIPLWLVLPLKIVGYNLVGTALERHWNIYVLAVGWGLHTFGAILTTSAVSAYVADAYPAVSGESAAWLNFARTLSGFILGYVQIPWAESQGTQIQYGIQSAIIGAAFVFFVLPMQFYGAKWRHASGPINLGIQKKIEDTERDMS